MIFYPFNSVEVDKYMNCTVDGTLLSRTVTLKLDVYQDMSNPKDLQRYIFEKMLSNYDITMEEFEEAFVENFL